MPFTLFCYQHSPEAALAFFDEHNAAIDGDQDHWEASYEFPGKFLQKKKTITFNFDRQWCSPPNWPTQLTGMQNFVAEFELDEAHRRAVMQLIQDFQYCIGIVNEPEIKKMDDPRFDVMNALAEHLNGIFFTPGALLDARFRPFAAIDGEVDPEAEVPVPTSVGEEVAADDDVDPSAPEPPDTERVAKRMYVLLAVAARGLLDMNLQAGNEPAYRLDELRQWLESIDVADELEESERKIIETPEQQLSHQDTINSVWRLEGLAVLAWALQLAEIPRYDDLVQADELMRALSFLDVPMAQHKLASADMRSAKELDAYNEQVWTFNWRLVDFRVRAEAVDYANVDVGYGKFDLSWATLLEGDLALRGVPIAQADPQVVGAANSAALERHTASNWLRGYARLYSNTSTDT